MSNNELLKEEIKEAFSDVKFPAHCGIHAAEEIDNWVSDPKVLKQITSEKDFSGNWWDIPEEHISGNSLGFNYLDSDGVLYYLPAFMCLAIDKPTYKNLYTLAWELSPDHFADSESDEKLLYQNFCNKFSKVTGNKRIVTIKFMSYLIKVIEQFSSSEAKRIESALNHDFWN